MSASSSWLHVMSCRACRVACGMTGLVRMPKEEVVVSFYILCQHVSAGVTEKTNAKYDSPFLSQVSKPEIPDYGAGPSTTRPRHSAYHI